MGRDPIATQRCGPLLSPLSLSGVHTPIAESTALTTKVLVGLQWKPADALASRG